MPIMNTVIAGGGSPAPSGLVRQYVNSSGTLAADPTAPLMDFTGITTIPEFALARAYHGNTTISAVDMSDFTTGGYGCLFAAFKGSTITSLDLSGLTAIPARISGYRGWMETMCANCTGLTSVDFSNLQSIGTQSATDGMLLFAFGGCTGGLNITFSSLTSISTRAFIYTFSGADGVTLSFPAVTSTSFTNTNSLTTMFAGMSTMEGDSWNAAQNVTLHFPSNVQAAVEALTGYSATAPFGAASGTVLFDLPATE